MQIPIVPKVSAISLPPHGLYEQVVDRLLERRLAALPKSSTHVDEEKLDPGESHILLADHLRRVAREVLDGLVGEDRLTKQLGLIDQILRELESLDPGGERRLSTPPRRLLSVWPLESAGGMIPERPDTPLAFGSLLAGTRLDPSLVSQLRKELASANRVDILCSFIKWSGIRILEEDLRAFTTKPSGRLRVLTTSYLGATDLKAIDFIQSLSNTEVRISYDTHRTRLYAKGVRPMLDVKSVLMPSLKLRRGSPTDRPWTRTDPTAPVYSSRPAGSAPPTLPPRSTSSRSRTTAA